MILAYSTYSKFVYDVTTGHMTLRFEIFWRKTDNWPEGNIHNCLESSDITTCMWIQVCIGHSGVCRRQYREVNGRLFVSYESYFFYLYCTPCEKTVMLCCPCTGI